MNRYCARMVPWVAFWILAAIATCSRAGAQVSSTLRAGLRASSGVGETGVLPTVTGELKGRLWRAALAVRAADKIDGGSGFLASAEGHVGVPVGKGKIEIGYRISRLDVERYAKDAAAVVLSFSSPMWRLELSQDDTPRRTQQIGLLWLWRWLWWRLDAYRWQSGPAPPGDGLVFSAGYRWRF